MNFMLVTGNRLHSEIHDTRHGCATISTKKLPIRVYSTMARSLPRYHPHTLSLKIFMTSIIIHNMISYARLEESGTHQNTYE